MPLKGSMRMRGSISSLGAYDITTDDPHMMVTHYQDIYGNSIQETEEELADISDDALIYTGISGNFCDMLPLQYEIFDDNYN